MRERKSDPSSKRARIEAILEKFKHLKPYLFSHKNTNEMMAEVLMELEPERCAQLGDRHTLIELVTRYTKEEQIYERAKNRRWSFMDSSYLWVGGAIIIAGAFFIWANSKNSEVAQSNSPSKKTDAKPKESPQKKEDSFVEPKASSDSSCALFLIERNSLPNKSFVLQPKELLALFQDISKWRQATKEELEQIRRKIGASSTDSLGEDDNATLLLEVTLGTSASFSSISKLNRALKKEIALIESITIHQIPFGVNTASLGFQY